jgi:hypothetical protein
MREVFLHSMRLYLVWWMEALGSRGLAMAPLGPRRLLVLLLLFPLFLAAQAMHWLGFLIDELLFRGYRKVEIKAPVFITGIPRSGTTFVHRILAADEQQFTTFRTWQALLAPSVTERKIVHALAYMDRKLGHPLQRLLGALTQRLTQGFSHIHGVGLDAAEEDYLSLLPAAGCFILVLAFPASPTLWDLGRMHAMPREQRAMLMDFYKRNLQRHVYCGGGGCRVLSKNAAFATWIPDLRRTFPDARFLLCIRDPDTALASQLSSVRDGLEWFGTSAAADVFNDGFARVFAAGYYVLREQHARMRGGQSAVIEQGRLRADAHATLEPALDTIGLPFTATMARALRENTGLKQQREKPHTHLPLGGSGARPSLGADVYDNYEQLCNVSDA